MVVVSFAFVFASSLLFYFSLALQNSFRLLRHEYNFFEFVCVFFPTNYTKYIVVFVLSISIMQTHTRSSTALSASILLTSPFNFSLLNEKSNKKFNTCCAHIYFQVYVCLYMKYIHIYIKQNTNLQT